MAHFTQEIYDRKREWRANHNNRQTHPEINEDLHDEICHLMSLRHNMHCNSESIFSTENDEYDVEVAETVANQVIKKTKINHKLSFSLEDQIENTVTDEDNVNDVVVDFFTKDEKKRYDESNEDDKENVYYSTVVYRINYEFAEKVNDDLHLIIEKINEKYDLNF